MSKLFNRAKMTTTTTGTGNLTLGSAASGFVTFATAGVVNGDVVRYCIEAENGTDFEVGQGTYTASGTVLSRADADVQLSSNSNNRITLAAGTHNVFITAADSDFTQEITVTVAAGKFVIDGTSQQIITLLPSITYRLDQSDSTNSSHPLVLASGSADGSTYSLGVRTVGTPGSKGSYTEVKLEQDAPALWYKCSSHSGMGASVNLAAPASGAASAVGTLTKTFTQNEEASITLSSAISPVPNVSVFKEIAQVGVSSKGTWDVDATASNYTRLDEATAVTLTPSAVGSGTFSLGSGSFASSDIGKTITGNGGVAVLTSAAGAYTTSTNFTNTNAIASGSWDMHGSVPKSDGSGLTLSSVELGYSVSGLSYDTNLTAGNVGAGTAMSGLEFKPDGTKFYITHPSNGEIKQYNLSTAFDLSSASVVTGFVGTGSQPHGVRFKADGTKIYWIAQGQDLVKEASVSTAWEAYSGSGAGYTILNTYNLQTSNSGNGSGATPTLGEDLFINSAGTYLFILCSAIRKVIRLTMTTAWDLSSLQSWTSGQVQDVVTTPSGLADEYNPKGMTFKPDGTEMYITGVNTYSIYYYTLSTAWDLSTASLQTSYFNFDNAVNPSTGNVSPEGISFAQNGQKLFVANSHDEEDVYRFTSGSTNVPTSQYFPSVTDASGQIDTSSWTDINSMTADETAGNGTLSYAISTDNHVTWKVIHNTSGTRSIAKNNSGTWQINTHATYGSETWSNATTNTELAALQQALATANNRMNKTQLDAVADANHITLGNTLDLMISPYMASGSTAPLSDGVSINYDASALNRQAINGTDYEAEFPSSTSVKIKSLAAQNLKVRVL